MLKEKLIFGLTVAGFLLFLLGAFFSFKGIETLPLLGSLDKVFYSYALVIASFMCGVHWGNAIMLEGRQAIKLLLSSNVLILCAWFSYLLFTTHVLTLILCVVFLTLLCVDYFLYKENVFAKSYFKLRLCVTFLVVFTLVLALV